MRNDIGLHHIQRPATTIQQMEREYNNITLGKTSRNIPGNLPPSVI